MALEPGYIFEQLTASQDLIHQAQLEAIRELQPAFDVDNDLAVESLLSRAVAGSVSVGIDVMSDVLATITAEIGRVTGLEQQDAISAVGTVTVTTDGADLRVLPAGATFVATAADQSSVPVVTTSDTTIPAGQTTVAGVPVRAVDPGAFANDLFGPLEPDQAYGWLEGVDLDSPMAGGDDGEDDDAFLARVSRRLQLLGDVLVRPQDVQLFALDVTGVGRAVAFNLLDPANPNTPAERTVTVAAADDDGEPLSAALKANLLSELERRREVNFRFFVVDPTYTTVNLELTAYVWPEQIAGAQEGIAEALNDWLLPRSWGTPNVETPGEWSNTAHVRVSEVIAIARNSGFGVDWIPPSSVKINGQNADLALSGIAPLTRPGTMTITVLERTP